MSTIQKVEMKHIVPDPLQPRSEFDPVLLDRLAKSIASQGILVPLALEKMPNNKFLLVDGERRYRASLQVGLKEVPAIIYDEMDSRQRVVTRFHLQEQHSNWSAFEKAKAIVIMQEENGMTSKEMAELLGMSYKVINDYKLLLTLSKRTVNVANQHKLPFDYLSRIATLLHKVDNTEVRRKVEGSLIERVKSGVITRASDISKLSYAMREAPKKTIDKLINHEEMSVNEIIESVGAYAKMEHDKLVMNASYLVTMLKKGMEHKTNAEMSESDANKFTRLAEVVNQYVDTAGVALK